MSVRSVLRDDAGFGLVELMVVIVIVGILAAVALPIFLGQAAVARDAAVQSDLATTRTAFVSIVTLGTESTEQNLRDFGQAISAETSNFEIYVNEGELALEHSDWWCLQETSATGATFHVGLQPGIHNGACNFTFYSVAYYVGGAFT